jgi:cbb3-type cytochrome oxidase maturation protein
MSVLVLLILASLGIAAGFLFAFLWAVRAGQFEDTCTPSMRVLVEEEKARIPGSASVSPASSFVGPPRLAGETPTRPGGIPANRLQTP